MVSLLAVFRSARVFAVLALPFPRLFPLRLPCALVSQVLAAHLEEGASSRRMMRTLNLRRAARGQFAVLCQPHLRFRGEKVEQ